MTLSTPRRYTDSVRIGPVVVGSEHSVAVQSMTDTDTNDVEGTFEQICRLHRAGCRIVRVTVPGMREVEAVRVIVEQVRRIFPDMAVVGDVHFLPSVALALAGVVDKVRINPGNYSGGEDFVELLDRCKATCTAIRIGVNHGSTGGRDMVDYAMEYLRVCRRHDFDQVVVSVKASDVGVMVRSCRELVLAMDAEGMPFPLHLGVTEAGNGLDGEVRSAVGIGALLVEGLGDTIRVSLTGPPEDEIPVAQAILQACGLDRSRAEIIACPGCGRTLFELSRVLDRVKREFGHLGGIKIAVMGCIVNGPGEMADADYGYVGAGRGLVSLYRGQSVVRKNLTEREAIPALVALLKDDGVWRDSS